MPETVLTAMGKRELSSCKWAGLLPDVMATDPSLKQSFKVVQDPSDCHSTFTEILQMV